MEVSLREDLFDAILAELAAEGYEGISIERALEEAGVSEEEFGADFEDKDACLFAAYEQLSARVLETTRSDCSESQAWPLRVRGGLQSLLTAIAAQPQLAMVVTRLFPAIRPAAYDRYVTLLSSFVPLMREGREYSSADEELPAEVELLSVGAAEAIIFGEVDAGRAAGLPTMMPEILFSVLVPFMGPERAAEEMRSASTPG